MLLLAVAVASGVALSAGGGLRVPGLPLRFGESLARADSTGAWRAEPSTGPGLALRAGRAPFFGVPSEVTLHFEDGRLVRAEARVAAASPRDLDYVRDELRRLGLHRACASDGPADSRCTWSGRAVVTVEITGRRLHAVLEPAPETAEVPASATGSGAPPDTARGRTEESGTPPFEAPAPTVIDSCVPRLPPAARRAGIQGRVFVAALVDTAGRVVDARIDGGIPELNDAALACARRYRYRPARANGRPVRAWTTIPVVFLLP